MAVKITREQAIELVQRQIDEMGEDYVYIGPSGEKSTLGGAGRCVNWDPGTNQPSCIVGRVLFAAGVPREELINKSYAAADAFEEYYADFWVHEFLSCLQSKQDVGVPWGRAMQLALRVANDE